MFFFVGVAVARAAVALPLDNDGVRYGPALVRSATLGQVAGRRTNGPDCGATRAAAERWASPR